MKSAADEVLAILKTEDFNDNDRKKEIEGIVDRLSDETFNMLTVFAQQLVDYSADMADEYEGEKREEVIDVNVDLDDSGSDSGEEDMERENQSDEENKGEPVEIIREDDSDLEEQKASE